LINDPSGEDDAARAQITMKHSTVEARVGDLLEARGTHGKPSRSGKIVEILGGPGHEHYRVRWDDQHESIVYPADGVSIARAPGRVSGARPAS
jgi:hypothetical protein